MKFKTIKLPISKEEKLNRIAEYCIDFKMTDKEKEEFLNKDIFDEYIEMKCLKCDHEITLDFDIIFELLPYYKNGYPEEYCHKCTSGVMVPIDIYNELKIKK